MNKYTLGGGSESSADGRSATGRAARGRSPYDIPVGGRQPMAFFVGVIDVAQRRRMLHIVLYDEIKGLSLVNVWPVCRCK